MSVQRLLLFALLATVLLLLQLQKSAASKDDQKVSENDLKILQRSFEVDIHRENMCSYNKKIADCREVDKSGIYKLSVPTFKSLLRVRCETRFLKGGWIVIQHRTEGNVDFFRSWLDYKAGFGALETEFWYGLEKISRLTNNGRYELMIVIENFDGNKAYAKYNHFVVAPETHNYKLERLGTYSGEAGNALQYHLGQEFTTYDRNNERHNGENCAITSQGAWWYRSCYQSNLNGKYPNDFEHNAECATCMMWNTFFRNKPLKTSLMMIRTSKKSNWEN